MEGNRPGLVRIIMLEVMGMRGNSKWVENLKQIEFGRDWMDECWDGGTGKAV